MLPKRLLLAAALLLQPLHAQQGILAQPFGPDGTSRIEVEALFSKASRGGFLPVQVTVSNKTKNGGKMNLHCVSSDNEAGQSSELTSDFEVNADPEKTTIQTVLVPLYNPIVSPRGFRGATVDFTMSGSFGGATGSIPVDEVEGDPLCLLSDTLYTKNASALDAEVATRAGGSYSYRGGSFSGQFDARKLPADWRAWSGYDAVGLTDADWTAMSAPARNALLQWNRFGGRLLIYNTGSADLKSLGIKTDGDTTATGKRSSGEVQILPLAPDLTLNPTATVNLFHGVGGSKGSSSFHQSINNDFVSAWPLQKLFGERSFQYTYFVLVLIAFAVLVGPVNLFVFAKSGRRHRLFITTPIIALGASLLLMAMIFLQDGMGGRGRRLVFMEVRPDNSENSAYIQQEQVSRTGVLLGSSFTLPGQAMITPVRLGISKWARFTNDAQRAWRFEEQQNEDGMKVTGDWFQSRSEQGQFIRTVVPTRGRIEPRSEAGAPAFVSTFDFPIARLWFTDSSGSIWEADKIEPGKTFTCHPGSDLQMKEEVNQLSSTLRPSALSMLGRRGYFFAATDAAPGVDTFRNISWESTHTLIAGPIAKP